MKAINPDSKLEIGLHSMSGKLQFVVGVSG
jgi:hypothetical protein